MPHATDFCWFMAAAMLNNFALVASGRGRDRGLNG
jgi:hypothetical protein